jgi:hypothetical protein
VGLGHRNSLVFGTSDICNWNEVRTTELLGKLYAAPAFGRKRNTAVIKQFSHRRRFFPVQQAALNKLSLPSIVTRYMNHILVTSRMGARFIL